MQTSSAANNRYTYTGREWDATLGLHHFRARWMNGLTGRFLSRDPIRIAFAQARASFFGLVSENLYRFVSNRVQSRVDPLGLLEIDPDDFSDFVDFVEVWMEAWENWKDWRNPRRLPPWERIDPFLPSPTLPIDVIVDFLFEVGTPRIPCNEWFRILMKGTTCAIATCDVKHCSGFYQTYDYVGPFNECVTKIQGQTAVERIVVKEALLRFAQGFAKT